MRLRARAKWVPKECAARAGALSAFLVPLFRPLWFVFQHGELDFALHVVNAVNDHADFVADGVRFLASGADDLASIFVVGVIVVGQGVERYKAFDKQLRQLHEEAEFGDADDEAVKVLTHALLHEFELLPFQQFALGLSGGALSLAGAFGNLMQLRL